MVVYTDFKRQYCYLSSVVEHFIGNEEVMSSILIGSFKVKLLDFFTYFNNIVYCFSLVAESAMARRRRKFDSYRHPHNTNL